MTQSTADAQLFAKHFLEHDALGRVLQARLISLSLNECVYEYSVNPDHFNPTNILHGGALFSVMDSSQGMLINYVLNRSNERAATGTATVKYFAPVHSGTITIKTILKDRRHRKSDMLSTAIDQSGKEVAALEAIWITLQQ